MNSKLRPVTQADSTEISPPMHSTNRRVMASPSPVPLCLRVTDPSALLERFEDLRNHVGGDSNT